MARHDDLDGTTTLAQRTLNTDDTTRPVRILGKLGSSFDAEVIAAGRAATRFLASRGLAWPDVIAGDDRQQDQPETWRDDVMLCVRAPAGVLTEWEVGFCPTVARYKRKPSPAQMDILQTLAAKVRKAGGTAP
jgi:hypothetical protein